MAVALTMAHRFDEAIDRLEQAMPLCREIGDTRGSSKAMGNLANVHLQLGTPPPLLRT
ncbi:tetratricopeptide repeat protein [Streptomyces violaceusniger]|uniref:tetratricopeptide repeat protein n=1 Tax=Streptomyces violaceusniger TaxID=68280 RepID=UPI00341EAE91